MSPRPLAALLLLLAAGSAHADAPPPPRSPRPEVRVSRLVGGRSLREVHARLRQIDMGDCQTTFMGGDVYAEIRIDAAGRLTVESTRAAEEPRVYAACVARRLAAARFAPGAANGTRAQVQVRFPSLGLGR